MTTPGSEPLDLEQLDINFRNEELTADDFESMVERIKWLEREKVLFNQILSQNQRIISIMDSILASKGVNFDFHNALNDKTHLGGE